MKTTPTGLRLMVRTGAHTCALPLSGVMEIMRPLPVEPLAGAPPMVRGLSVIRGEPVPVLDLATMLGENGGSCTRFVTVRAGVRRVALAVELVLGVREFAPSVLHAMPPLLGEAAADLVEALSTLDAELFLVLKTSSMAPVLLADSLARSEAR